ncbi:hypothetical protein [Actinokineospora spheciospongiae]|nr:hypothetical protein [Actinokineospora spheciospongiae]
MARRAVMPLFLASTLFCAPAIAAADPVAAPPAPPTAASAPAPARAEASVGGGTATLGAEAVEVEPLAPCTSDGASTAGGPPTATTGGTAADSGPVGFGPGKTTCTPDRGTGVAKAFAEGRDFRIDALRAHGGPTITVRRFSAGCTTMGRSVSSAATLAGVSGLSTPWFFPVNHTITVPGATAADPPLAAVTVNAVSAPDREDRSVTVSALKIRFFPEGGPESGTLLVGTVTCTPAAQG